LAAELLGLGWWWVVVVAAGPAVMVGCVAGRCQNVAAPLALRDEEVTGVAVIAVRMPGVAVVLLN
jgi:hypothetical protein